MNDPVSEEEAPGTLAPGEIHPAAYLAIRWIRRQPPLDVAFWHESLTSASLDGDRTAEILAETLRRVLANEPVSDRYVTGLAWMLRYGKEET